MARERLTRAERKAQTRDELLRAAARLFLRKGYVATTVDDIAAAAGVTTGAVYSNFETKEDMFLALVDALPNPDATWISEETTAPDDLSSAVGNTPEERASSWGRSLAGIRADRRVVSLMAELNAAALRSERSRTRVAHHNTTFFQDLGGRLVELLEGEPEDAELLGILAQSIYSGFSAHAAITGDAITADDFARVYRLLAVLANDRVEARR